MEAAPGHNAPGADCFTFGTKSYIPHMPSWQHIPPVQQFGPGQHCPPAQHVEPLQHIPFWQPQFGPLQPHIPPLHPHIQPSHPDEPQASPHCAQKGFGVVQTPSTQTWPVEQAGSHVFPFCRSTVAKPFTSPECQFAASQHLSSVHCCWPFVATIFQEPCEPSSRMVMRAGTLSARPCGSMTTRRLDPLGGATSVMVTCVYAVSAPGGTSSRRPLAPVTTPPAGPMRALYWPLPVLPQAATITAATPIQVMRHIEPSLTNSPRSKLDVCLTWLPMPFVRNARTNAETASARADGRPAPPAPYPPVRLAYEPVQSLPGGPAKHRDALRDGARGRDWRRRFESPRQLMVFVGLVPRGYSSGDHEKRRGITKSGNGHVRRILVEAAFP